MTSLGHRPGGRRATAGHEQLCASFGRSLWVSACRHARGSRRCGAFASQQWPEPATVGKI